MTDVDMSESALDEFEALLSESFGDEVSIEGSVVKGTIISIEGDSALIDVGLKSEGVFHFESLLRPVRSTA